MSGIQTADKPRKRKNSFRQKKCGRDFCLLRQRHMQPAVTYVYVSSLDCKFASLPCRFFQRLAKRRLCQRFDGRMSCVQGSGILYACLSSAILPISGMNDRADRFALGGPENVFQVIHVEDSDFRDALFLTELER